MRRHLAGAFCDTLLAEGSPRGGPYTLKMPTRRGFCSMAAAATLLAASRPGAWARPAPALDVAYAGSMAPLMEGAMKSAAAAALGVDVRGRAQGASALAELIAGGSLRPDVFIAVTPGPMRVVLDAGKA